MTGQQFTPLLVAAAMARQSRTPQLVVDAITTDPMAFQTLVVVVMTAATSQTLVMNFWPMRWDQGVAQFSHQISRTAIVLTPVLVLTDAIIIFITESITLSLKCCLFNKLYESNEFFYLRPCLCLFI